MLRSADDVRKDQTVYLYPHTKMAGRWCWMHKEAVVIDAKTQWPRVKVQLEHDGNSVVAYIHKDDIKLKPVAKTKQGDMGDGGRVEAGTHRRLALPKDKAHNIDLKEGEEQLPLF